MGFSVKFVIFSIVFFLTPSLGWAKRQEVPEVTKRQLESLIKTEDYLAVFWCKFSCFIFLSHFFLIFLMAFWYLHF